MLDHLEEIEKAALESLQSVREQSALEAWSVANLGRSSPLMTIFSELGKLSKEERPFVGQAANRVKLALESALEERSNAVKEAWLAKSLEEEALDVTLPGRDVHLGRLHPSTQQLRRVLEVGMAEYYECAQRDAGGRLQGGQIRDEHLLVLRHPQVKLVPLQKFERDVILQTWGIPPEQFGITESSNRAVRGAGNWIYETRVVYPRGSGGPRRCRRSWRRSTTGASRSGSWTPGRRTRSTSSSR